jgi:hypothetical protein
MVDTLRPPSMVKTVMRFRTAELLSTGAKPLSWKLPEGRLGPVPVTNTGT